MRIRMGTAEDADAMLSLLDASVRWLVATGRAGQWGEAPFSARPDQVERVMAWAASGDLRVAETADGSVAGTLVIGEAPSYVPPPVEPELYLQAFVTDPSRRGQGVGTALLDHARAEALAQGIRLLRVDCWAGGDKALVGYYVRAGFTPTAAFSLGGWPGQILEQRLTAEPGARP